MLIMILYINLVSTFTYLYHLKYFYKNSHNLKYNYTVLFFLAIFFDFPYKS